MKSLHSARLSVQWSAADAQRFDAACARWQQGRNTQRLILGDASLWTGGDESKWLGWLNAASDSLPRVPALAELAADVHARGFTHALLLGMGGSSMCPEVLAAVFGAKPGFPELLVLDSTDPAQVRTFERRVDVARTLFIVASKSGSTLEPSLLAAYFLARAQAVNGADAASRQFVAITDPGSALDKLARASNYWRVFHGVASIGGRYSALSGFGLVPAAILGLDVRHWLDGAMRERARCGHDDPLENPGVALGLAIGTLALAGRDKLTLVPSRALAPFGAWLEQLLAESLGKHGKGLVPIEGEALGPPSVYAADRVFVRLQAAPGSESGIDRAAELADEESLRRLVALGHPVITIALDGAFDLAAEFLRWSVATAAAGHVLGVHPFDQPDVEAAKVAARTLATRFETHGASSEGVALAEAGPITVYPARDGTAGTVESALRGLVDRIGPGDYVGLLAFIEMNRTHAVALERMRLAIRDATRAATTVGFGPRYLHSSGQLHKGGPDNGVFIVITHTPEQDLAVPDRSITFGLIELAQGRGDFDVLAERGRRALRVHLRGPLDEALAALEQQLRAAL